jgi:hypothetical protein
MSFVILIVLLNFGMSTKAQVDNFRDEAAQLEASNFNMKQTIKDRGYLGKSKPVLLSTEYGSVMNQVRILESYSGTNMSVQLEASKDSEDISDHYIDTVYKGVKGLKIKIVVDGFSKETNMEVVLDDIHLLEKNTDFMASEISKDNNNLFVKGEIYGI